MANLKVKFEADKTMFLEAFQKVRTERKALQEAVSAHAAERLVFAQRCDEYTTQINALQHQLTVAEEEKKTVNALLRMAIQQKVALSNKVDDLESDRERKATRLWRPIASSRSKPPVASKLNNNAPPPSSQSWNATATDEPSFGRYQPRWTHRRDY